MWAGSTNLVGKSDLNWLKILEIHYDYRTVLRHNETVRYNLNESAGRAEIGRARFLGAMGMRDWFVLMAIMVLGFGFTLGKLAFDEWRIKRSQRP